MEILRLLLALPILAVLFWLIERPWRAPGRVARTRRAWALDVAFWLFTPLVGRPLSRALVGAVVVLAAWLVLGIRLSAETGAAPLTARGPASGLPDGVQVVLLVLGADLLGYAMHRAMHRGRWLWRVHVIHHAPEQLDWLSAARVHPLNDVLMRSAQALPLLLLGFEPLLLAGVAPTLGLYALLLHTRLPWRYGPLRYVVASPAFHRWHHARDVPGEGCNFAGLLSLWDVLFGTFYLPEALPEAVGVRGEAPPERLLAQLLWPLQLRIH